MGKIMFNGVDYSAPSSSNLDAVTGVKGNAESTYRQGNVNITPANIGLGNVPNVKTNDQTVTYSDTGTLATLTSGEKISVAFAKIKKAISELISHIADTTKHITSAERTKWNNITNKLDATGNASNVTNTFSAASSRSNLTTGEKLSVSLGKIMKYFADLKTVAFSGSYNDLSNKPSIPSVTNNLTSTSTTSALSAAQGKVLNDKILNASNRIPTLTNSLTATTTGTALDAAQGKVLNDKITDTKNGLGTQCLYTLSGTTLTITTK